MYLTDKAHFGQDLLEIKVVATNIEPQFVKDHLELVFELAIAVMCEEIALENGVSEDLVPGDTICFLDFQTLLQKIDSLIGKVFAFDAERLFFNISNQLDLAVGSPRSLSVQEFIEDEAECPDIAFAGV